MRIIIASLLILGNLFFLSSLFGDDFQSQIDYNSSFDLPITFTGSTLWGNIKDVIYDEPNVYCVLFSGLEIYEIDSQHEFLPKSRLYYQCGAYCIDKSGDLVCIGLKDSGMAIIDVSDIANPHEIGRFNPGRTIPVAKFSGNYIYAANDNSLDILDISNPSAPELVANYILEDFEVWQRIHNIKIVNDTCYIATDDFWILDISDIENITQIAHLVFPTDLSLNDYSAHDLDVKNDLVFIACQSVISPPVTSGLVSVDISDPEHPQKIDEYTFPGSCYNITVDGDFAYVGAGLSGLITFDISDSTSVEPISCNYIDGYYSFKTILINGTELLVVQVPFYTTAYDYGYDICNGIEFFPPNYLQKKDQLLVYDVENKAAPNIIGRMSDRGVLGKIAIAGSNAYVVDLLGGFYTVDISDLDSIDVISYMDLESTIDFLPGGYFSVFDNVVYYPAGECGLYAVDVTDPANPTQIFLYDDGNIFYDVAKQGNYLYLAGGYGGLIVLDIYNIENPVLIQKIPVYMLALNIEINSDFAYLACREGDLQIYDISDVENITYISSLEIENDIVGRLSLGNNRIFLNGSYSDFYCVDISNPYSPELLYQQDLNDVVYDMCWQNDRLYLANYYGLNIYDVSNSLSATQLNDYETSGFNLGVAVLDSTILITGWNNLIRLNHEIITAIDSENNNLGIPQNYNLSQNYPNPFNESTIIEFSVPETQYVALTIYNILGQKVRNLVEAEFSPNAYSIRWDGQDNDGHSLASGVYFYQLKYGDYYSTKKLLLLK